MAIDSPSSTGGLNHVRSVRRPPTYEATAIAAVNADRTQPEITAARSRSTSTELTNSGTSTIAITSAGADDEVDEQRQPHGAAAEQTAVDQRVARCGAAASTNSAPATSATGYSQRRSVPSAGQLVEPVDALDLGRCRAAPC